MTIIDDTDRERIAFRSTQGAGIFAKDRWSEFAVYYLRKPGAGGQRFVAEIVGRSTRKGEKDRMQAKASHRLEDALEIFLDRGRATSLPVGHVVQEARTWAAQHCTADGYPESQPTYTEAQRAAAVARLRQANFDHDAVDADYWGKTVDALAEALGMRRAQA